MKRKHINLTRSDPYGHWWFEIGDATDEAGLGQRIEYADTQNPTEFFQVVVDDSGFGGRATRFRKELFFKDAYFYGANGKPKATGVVAPR